MSFYAKQVDRTRCKCEFSTDTMVLEFETADGTTQKFDWQLFSSIDPQRSQCKVMSTKIEVTLVKANGLSWPALERTAKVQTWTTFGVSGRTGTVGSTEMVVADDIPIVSRHQ